MYESLLVDEVGVFEAPDRARMQTGNNTTAAVVCISCEQLDWFKELRQLNAMLKPNGHKPKYWHEP
jgi:hypothetical protein